MNTRERKFITAYLTGPARYNGSGAAKLVGYACPRQAAYRLLKRAHVRGAIEAHQVTLKMQADEVLHRLAAIARGSIEDLGRVDEAGRFTLDLVAAQRAGKLGIIRSLRRTPYGYAFELDDARQPWSCWHGTTACWPHADMVRARPACLGDHGGTPR